MINNNFFFFQLLNRSNLCTDKPVFSADFRTKQQEMCPLDMNAPSSIFATTQKHYHVNVPHHWMKPRINAQVYTTEVVKDFMPKPFS